MDLGWLGGLLALGLLLWAYGFAAAALLALHAVADILDEEGLSWPACLARALRHTLNYSGQATRAEFWGYAVFYLLAWLICRGWFRSASVPLGLLLGLPMLSLAWRRLKGMNEDERLALASWLTRSIAKALRRR